MSADTACEAPGIDAQATPLPEVQALRDEGLDRRIPGGTGRHELRLRRVGEARGGFLRPAGEARYDDLGGTYPEGLVPGAGAPGPVGCGEPLELARERGVEGGDRGAVAGPPRDDERLAIPEDGGIGHASVRAREQPARTLYQGRMLRAT